MLNTLIGIKKDQTQSFLQNGRRIPVTEIVVSENVVVQVKNAEKDAYSAVQLGFGIKKKPTRALLGHAKKAGQKSAPLKIKEVRLNKNSEEEIKAGDLLTVEGVFKPGDLVQVTGTSKGKGFAGVVRRYNFRGGPKTHGQSDRHRAPGSIGQTTTPGRVYKGKRMAGRMGSDTVTITNLTVVDVDQAGKKLYVSGLVPGHKNSLLTIVRTGEDKKFVPLLGFEEKNAATTEATAETPVEEAKAEMDEPTEEVKAEVQDKVAVEEVSEPADEKKGEEIKTEAAQEDASKEPEADTSKSDEVEKDVKEEKSA